MIIGRIFWTGPGWYASRVEMDSNMEVIMPLECACDGRLPSQAQQDEARQKGLGTPFFLAQVPPGIEKLR